MRKPDKPGTFRIVNNGGTVTLTGRKVNGDRVRIPLLSRQEAEDIASKLFPSIGLIPGAPLLTPEPFRSDVPLHQRSDIPVADFPEQADFWNGPGVKKDPSALNASMGIPSLPPSTPVTSVEEAEKKAKRAKNAKSLMELAGVGWAAGSVWAGRAICERTDKEPPNPNPKQVNDLADVTKDTLSEWFGDREIKPWMMMFLLTLGIPISMLLQAKPRKPSKDLPEVKSGGNLTSLP